MAFDRKAYREKNKAKILAQQKEWRLKNKEKNLAMQKKYDQTIKGKYTRYKESAKTRGYNFTLTVDEFETFWQKPCHYCGDSIDTIGLDRIDSNIGYQLDNIVSCCTFCNMAKKDWTEQYFFDKIEKIYLNRKGLL